jgi:hypothetical protein
MYAFNSSLPIGSSSILFYRDPIYQTQAIIRDPISPLTFFRYFYFYAKFSFAPWLPFSFNNSLPIPFIILIKTIESIIIFLKKWRALKLSSDQFS